MAPSAAAGASAAADAAAAAEPRHEKSATPHGAADSAGDCGTRLEEGRRTPLDISSSEKTPRRSWTFPVKLGRPKAIALVALSLCLAAGVLLLYFQGEAGAAEADAENCPEGMQPALTGTCAGALAKNSGRRLMGAGHHGAQVGGFAAAEVAIINREERAHFLPVHLHEGQEGDRERCKVCVAACLMTAVTFVGLNNHVGVTGTHVPVCPEVGPSPSTICTRTFNNYVADTELPLHHPGDHPGVPEKKDGKPLPVPLRQSLQESHEFPSWTGPLNTDGFLDSLAAEKEGEKEKKDWSVEAALHQIAQKQAGSGSNFVEPDTEESNDEKEKLGWSHKLLNLDKVKEKLDKAKEKAACAKAHFLQ